MKVHWKAPRLRLILHRCKDQSIRLCRLFSMKLAQRELKNQLQIQAVLNRQLLQSQMRHQQVTEKLLKNPEYQLKLAEQRQELLESPDFQRPSFSLDQLL